MRDSKKGFTIIEVVVVLAIAGLIFGVVFWALPNLQKSNRDNTRKNIAANILTNLDQFSSNNNGAYPTDETEFIAFLGDFFTNGVEDPLGDDLADSSNITFDGGLTDSGGTFNAQISYSTGYQCTTGGAITSVASGQRAIAVQIDIEQGGLYCVDNN